MAKNLDICSETAIFAVKVSFDNLPRLAERCVYKRGEIPYESIEHVARIFMWAILILYGGYFSIKFLPKN